MPSLKTTKETPLMEWQKPLTPIIRSFNTSSQIQNGISRQSNAQGWKSFKNKEPLLPPKTGFSPLMTLAARNPLQRRPREQSGNIADHSKGKRSAMSVSALLSSQTQSIFPSTSFPTFLPGSFPEEKTTPGSKTKYKSPWNSLTPAQKPWISPALSSTPGMRQHASSRTFTRKAKSFIPK